MRNLDFVKMQGLGNDFVVLEGPMQLKSAEITELCNRRFGIGADGVLVATQGDPVRMEYWNADGSPAELCGNGLGCVARYAYDRGWAPDRNFAIHTRVGVRSVRVLPEDVEVELGRPSLSGVRSIDGVDYEVVDIGNPHAVAMVSDPETADVAGVGSSLQAHFDNGANVEFVSLSDGGLNMRVWERGVGETMACGTGMAAAAAVAQARNGIEGPVSVTVPGGQASVDFRDGVAWLRGPAEYSFRGSVGER